jgi:His/Glu/Gln/Arg/opine family amino acid ABC transporter permease subunit
MSAILENFFNAGVFARSTTLIAIGIVNLLYLFLASFVLAIVVGVILAAIRGSRFRLLQTVVVWIVDVARSLPPLVSLVIVFYLVPPINGFSLTNLQAAVLTFGLIQGAYMSEIFRGGLAAVSPGQHLAATALGMTGFQTARYVIAPQVFRTIIPPLTSQATQLVRDSSLAFFIGYQEVVTMAKLAVTANSNSTPYTMAIVFYALLLVSMQLLSTNLERRRARAG